jgi:hypothetical protein
MVWNHYLRWPKSTTETFWLWDEVHPNARGHVSTMDLLFDFPFEGKKKKEKKLNLRCGIPSESLRIY